MSTKTFESVSNEHKTSEAYIIHMNEELRKINIDSIKSLQLLQIKNDELEEEVGSLEAKHNYNKNLLKNFHEMTKYYQEIDEYRIYMSENTQLGIRYF